MKICRRHGIFWCLVFLNARAASPRHIAGDDGLVAMQLNQDGALSIRAGADRLLQDSLPKLYHLDWLEDGEEKRPDFHWMTRPTAQRFDPDRNTLEVEHQWGRNAITFRDTKDRIELEVQVKNSTDKKIVRMTIWLTGGFEFPETPKGHAWSKGWAVMTKAGAPAVAMADYGRVVVAACLVDPRENASIGWGTGKRLALRIGDLAPGQEVITEVSLRFGPGSDTGADPHKLVQDIYQAFAKKHPMTRPEWPDRRAIAALHPSSSHLGSGTAGRTTNPRGWIFGGGKIDVTTEEGKAHFAEAAMDFARRSVEICQGMNAQGMVCWSVEGQEWPHAISYLGSPDRIAEAAPEMDAIADQWFKIFVELAKRHPDCMLIPEHETVLYWACSVPLGETSPRIQHLWPDAFSVNLMQHFKHTDPDHIQRCVELVRRGDILLFHGWYNAAANGIIREIYERNHHPTWHAPRGN